MRVCKLQSISIWSQEPHAPEDGLHASAMVKLQALTDTSQKAQSSPKQRICQFAHASLSEMPSSAAYCGPPMQTSKAQASNSAPPASGRSFLHNALACPC